MAETVKGIEAINEIGKDMRVLIGQINAEYTKLSNTNAKLADDATMLAEKTAEYEKDKAASERIINSLKAAIAANNTKAANSEYLTEAQKAEILAMKTNEVY